jgi:hypothetical protein
VLPKQLFVVTNDQLCAWQWRRGRLSGPERFANDAAGLVAFAHYVDGHASVPAYLVADLVEEDFQRQLLPHVGGRPGRELTARRLRQLYRDTPYRHALVQGRDPEGRRDDHVLFSALTNAAPLQRWTAALEQRRVPLAAVYSAPFLSALLVRKLALAQDHLLLITEQAGGLRQSYFQGFDLKFSRLTELAPHDGVAAHICAETARMQQFLTSTRLLGRGDLLRVVVLTPPGRIAELEPLCEDGPEIAFHFVDIGGAAARLRLDPAPQLADRLLLALVGKHAPASQFALGHQARFYQLWQARLALNAATALLVAGSALWAASDIWSILADGRERGRLLAEAADFDQRYRAVMAGLPPAAARTANMKAAVQVESLLKAQAPAPAALMALVSQSLERAPAINLVALDWNVEQPSAAPAGTGAGVGEAVHPIAASAVGIPRAPAQVLRIEGDLAAAQHSYREILDNMNRFAADLAQHPGIRVEVLEAPLDVRPNVKLAGKAGAAEPGAMSKFALKVSWTP